MTTLSESFLAIIAVFSGFGLLILYTINSNTSGIRRDGEKILAELEGLRRELRGGPSGD